VSEASGPFGAEVTFEGTANSDIAIKCLPASGSLFPIGTTPVNCTGIGVTGRFEVTVVDTSAPTLLLPGPIKAPATSTDGAVVSFSASASDIVDGPLTVTCTPPSGSTFALGTTTVSCSATDSHLNTSNGIFTVTVIGDVTAPLIVSITATPDVLWPPNHQLVPVMIAVSAIDDVDQAPMARIYLITSNEPIVGAGSGSTNFDWRITGNLTVDLRAERSGNGNDRVYTIHIECIDQSGNRNTGTVTVLVPHDQRRRSAGRG
jgi:HYR domain-containing protein